MTGPETRGAIDEAALERFKSGWARGRPEPIEPLLPHEEDSNYASTLEELVCIELESAWKSWGRSRQGTAARDTAGQGTAAQPLDETIDAPPQVEAYLARFPRLNRPEIVLRLLRREYSVRKHCGQAGSIEEFRRRYPDLPIDQQQFESGLPMLSEDGMDAPLADTLAQDTLGGMGAGGMPSGDFGNYELLEEIGRGGMGIVYRARQKDADRIVAVKVIRRDRLETLPRDTQSTALDRFRHEAQAAARLEHEHIVTVYEVGEVDGQPFFSMRYVEGRSLAEMVQDGPLENRRAARYMEPVARAVQEAHCQGILHRDLKPQNTLVDSRTEHALVADFGLAKLSEGQEELTRAGEVMGTPQYMSPEQAKDSANVTAETDIYGLGATLYHILTGRPPFQAATPVETLRQVMDEEPAPPRQVNPSIDRDLETICLKCLQKEPSRRYVTAQLLAEDLRRYLDGEPILARPIGLLGRTVRWCRRNPVIAVWIALAATFLVLALVASTVGYYQTSEALADSEESRAAAEKSRAMAERRLDDLGEAANTFFGDVMDETLLNEPGMQPLRKKLVTHALPYYEQFVRERSNDPEVQDELALAHFRVGRINDMVDKPKTALDSYQTAQTIQETLLAERPSDGPRLRALGNTLNAIGRVLDRVGRRDEAMTVFRQALKWRTQLVNVSPEDAAAKRTLANIYMNIGIIERQNRHYDEAAKRFQEAQKVRIDLLAKDADYHDARRDLGMGYFNLANLAVDNKEFAKAAENYTLAIEAFEEFLAEKPDALAEQRQLAICYRFLADLECGGGEHDAGLAHYRKAIELLETLAAKNPTVPEYRADLAGVFMNLGFVELRRKRLQATVESFEQARRLLEVLVEEYADVPQYRLDFAVTLRTIAQVQSKEGQVQAARENLQTAEEHLSLLLKGFPDVPQYRCDLAVTLYAIAQVQLKEGQVEAARENLRTAEGHLRVLLEQFPEEADFKDRLNATRAALAKLNEKQPEAE